MSDIFAEHAGFIFDAVIENVSGLTEEQLNMSDIFAEHAGFIFDAVIENVSGLTEEQLNWKPIEESDNIRKILTHMTRIALILIPQVIDGTVNSEGWDDDYEKVPHTERPERGV